MTEKSVQDYTAGLKTGLSNATALVAGGSGGMFTAKTWATQESHDPYGANTALVGISSDPAKMLRQVAQSRNASQYDFLIFVNRYSNLARAAGDLGSECSQAEIAAFMLALQPGCYLMCQGWDKQFEFQMGAPLGPAVSRDGRLVRQFASGTRVEYITATQTATIHWAGRPTQPTPLLPTPAPPTPPVPTPNAGPVCPGPKCPPVPAANHQGCFVDKTGGVCDLPVVPKQSTGHCAKSEGAHNEATANTSAEAEGGAFELVQGQAREHEQAWPAGFTVEYCNALCAPLGKRFFGVQAGHACFCGDAFGSQGVAAAAECNSTCTGNTSEACGGLKRNSVYAVQPLPL